MKRLLYIVNPISGIRKAGSNLPERLLALTNKETWGEASVCFTEYAGHATELATRAMQEGVEAVVAVGGDGTVNEVARALVGSPTALGIVPRGSGNGLARHLQLPLGVERSVSVINKACIRALDSGLISERPFFCTCGVGFDAFISQRFAEAGRRGAFTYLLNTLRTGLTYQPAQYTLQFLDEKGVMQKRSFRAFLVAVANASQYGNNAFIAPSAHMSDGLLDVVVIHPFSVVEGPRVAVGLMDGSLPHNPRVRIFRTSRLTLEREAPGLAHLDGEPWTDAPAALDISILPGTLRTIVNAEAAPRHCDLRDWLRVET